jgi:hypothetical protein
MRKLKFLLFIIIAFVFTIAFTFITSAHTQNQSFGMTQENRSSPRWRTFEGNTINGVVVPHWPNSSTRMRVSWGDFTSNNTSFQTHINAARTLWNNAVFPNNGPSLIDMTIDNTSSANVVFRNRNGDRIAAVGGSHDCHCQKL